MLTLALGIGANTAIFSVVNAVLIRPLPYRDPSQLVYISEFWPRETPVRTVPSPDFANWSEHDRLFDGLAAYGGGAEMNLTSPGEPERILGAKGYVGLFPLARSPAIARARLSSGRGPAGWTAKWCCSATNYGSGASVLTRRSSGRPSSSTAHCTPSSELYPLVSVSLTTSLRPSCSCPWSWREHKTGVLEDMEAPKTSGAPQARRHHRQCEGRAERLGTTNCRAGAPANSTACELGWRCM